MLPARIGTAGHADARRIIKINRIFEIVVQLDCSILRFRQRELAELNPGAGNDRLSRPRRLIFEPKPVEVSRERFKLTLGNVEQDHVLRVGGSYAAATVFFSQIRKSSQVISRCSPSQDR